MSKQLNVNAAISILYVYTHVSTVQVIKKCPDVLSVLLGTDSSTVRSTVSTTVHSTVSTYVRYASKNSVRTVR